MNFYEISWRGKEGFGYNYGMIINNIYMIFSWLIVVLYPGWLYWFLKRKYYELQFASFKAKYENAYGDIELFDNEQAIWEPVLYLLRRLAMAIICVCMIGYPIFQIGALFACQIVYIIFLGHVKPYDGQDKYKNEYFNEAMIFLIVYHLITYSDEYIRNSAGRTICGYSMIVCTLFVVLANVGILVSKSVHRLRLIMR